MITVEQAKDRYLIKAEKNGTNDNITTDNYRFCLNFNESQNKYLTLQLQNRGIDDVRYIQKFLKLDEIISSPITSENKSIFKLPKNYFDLSSVRIKAKKNNCQVIINNVFEVKTENINEVLLNEYLKPSFDWRRAPYTINNDNLSVYINNFKVEELLLNYYRYPNKLELESENDPESKIINTEIEWDDKSLDDIISLMVFNLDINEENSRYQLNTLRIQK